NTSKVVPRREASLVVRTARWDRESVLSSIRDVKAGRPALSAVAALGLIAPRADGAPAEGAAAKTCSKPGVEWTRRLVSRSAITIGGMVTTADGGVVVAGCARAHG